MSLSLETLRRLPKTDLHLHLDGSLRPKTVWELAKAQGVKVPAKTVGELSNKLKAGDRTRSLADYLRIFDITLSVLQEKEALQRVAYELAEDCATENIRHAEVRYSPILHQKGGLDLPDIVEAVLQGLKEAERDFGLSTGVILCGMRNISPKRSVELAELAVVYRKKGVVGFDLAGEEKDYPAKDHREAFEIVLKHNINSTVHAGEGFGPPSIAQALHHCGAHRIGHGTRLVEDAELLQYVLDHRIPLEVCLTSNVQTRTVPSLPEHPFKQYLDAGVRVTLNTDNTMVSNTTISKEYARAARTFGLSPYQVKRIVISGFKSAFLPYAQKARLLRQVIVEIDNVFMEAFPESYDRAASVL
ncbi:MAG TPA: adenosine deaminase [Candidatus Eisenbacteria bacterium]|jgi:adenosine deaminase|nr:adenosine deaminase [Candidatus Eisenbacteria bacterium]